MKQKSITPYKKGYLQIDDIHKIFYSCWGNKAGKAILLLHGGPGYGSDRDMLNDLDLNKWDIIMYDQRGCGLSLPLGEIKNNTTAFLVDDIKALLDYLRKKKVVIKGSSWGATLAVAFAEKYPSYVDSMILLGYFNGENDGTCLGKRGGFENYYPDLYNEYISLLKEQERDAPYKAYYSKIINNDNDCEKLARKLIQIESLIEKSHLDYSYAEAVCESVDVCSVAKIETYYSMNDFFLEENELLNNSKNLINIKITMIHGRLDIITPVLYAWKFSRALPLCKLIIVDGCGHDIDSAEGQRIIKNIIDDHLLQCH